MRDDEIHFSRHAVDSTDEAMDMTFSKKMPGWSAHSRAKGG